MKAASILASTALCLSLAAASLAQKPTLTASRTGLIPAGGGVVGIQGAITNTSSDKLTIIADTITVSPDFVLEDFIKYVDGFNTPYDDGFGNPGLVINPNATFTGHSSASAQNRDMNNMLLPGAQSTPYLFTVTYTGPNVMPTDPSQGTVQLSYTLGNNPTVFTDSFTFPAIQVTPEPGIMALIGSGLVSGGLLVARRRCK